MPFPARRRGNKVKGVQFTVMVVGASPADNFDSQRTHSLLGAAGNGRTTFVNTLCESEVLQHKMLPSPEDSHEEEKIRIKPISVGENPSAASCTLPHVR